MDALVKGASVNISVESSSVDPWSTTKLLSRSSLEASKNPRSAVRGTSRTSCKSLNGSVGGIAGFVTVSKGVHSWMSELGTTPRFLVIVSHISLSDVIPETQFLVMIPAAETQAMHFFQRLFWHCYTYSIRRVSIALGRWNVFFVDNDEMSHRPRLLLEYMGERCRT